MKKLSLLLFISSIASTPLLASSPKVGVVNFNQCLTLSKLGKQEQNSFEEMRKQFASLIEDTEKQIKEVVEKLQDRDYLDGVSPETEQQMKNKYAELSEDLNRQRQQYYQSLQQGQYATVQAVISGIQTAAEKIASKNQFGIVINKEACFYASETLDVTSDVIQIMDKNFDADVAAANSPSGESKR